MFLYDIAVAVFFFTKQFNLPIEHENRNTTRTGVPFRLSPDPLPPAFPHLRTLNSPPPRGVGGAGGNRFAECALIRFAIIASIRPVSLAPARSTTRNQFAGHPRRSVKLIVYSIRETGRSRRRHPAGGVSDIPTACGLASRSPPIRYGRRDDDVPGRINLRTVSMAD